MRAAAVAQLERQVRWCRELGSPLYAGLLERAVADARDGGVVSELLAPWAGAREGDVPALRLLGAVHRIVLEGGARDLEAFYPSVEGDPTRGDPWPAFRAVLSSDGERIAELMRRPVQTNEVGRSAALLGGFLVVARETGLPLRLLELGASAGLNLRWDHYRYDRAGGGWGDEASPVRVEEPFAGAGRPPLDVAVRVLERRGCDARPVDPTGEEGRLTLLAYVWPDMTARFERLSSALEVARLVGARVDEADLLAWLAATPLTGPGAATVVFHSIVMQYLPRESRARVSELLDEAGAAATAAAPLAWLRLEPGSKTAQAEVRLRTWPGGEERLLATARFHGPPVRWLAAP